jgi:hypothetical protein
MASQWYHGRGSDISGPFTDRELFNLAENGEVVPSDMIWREGVEAGVRASTVKNLFQVSITPVSPAQLPPDLSQVDTRTDVVAATVPVKALQNVPRLGRATPGKGAIILSQDGKTVKYKGKCTICGREESSYKSIPIPRGTARVGFFCAKCRKRRDVEIHGVF